MKPIINFIFSVGYRCYSPDFLKTFKLRKMSGPFDYLFIDFETALKIINDNFDNYLYDIILFNKTTKNLQLFYKKNTNEISNNLYELLENNIGYMAHNYNNVNLIFNQNYLDDKKLSDNLYDWSIICSFHHHNIIDNNVYNLINQRCERFNYIRQKYNKTTALFHITKIIDCTNISEYMNSIIELKKKYNIDNFLIVIINCTNVEDNSFYDETNRYLFIVKKVEKYSTQYLKYQTDNNLNYEKEFNTISNYFTLNLIEKDAI